MWATLFVFTYAVLSPLFPGYSPASSPSLYLSYFWQVNNSTPKETSLPRRQIGGRLENRLLHSWDIFQTPRTWISCLCSIGLLTWRCRRCRQRQLGLLRHRHLNSSSSINNNNSNNQRSQQGTRRRLRQMGKRLHEINCAINVFGFTTYRICP